MITKHVQVGSKGDALEEKKPARTLAAENFLEIAISPSEFSPTTDEQMEKDFDEVSLFSDL